MVSLHIDNIFSYIYYISYTSLYYISAMHTHMYGIFKEQRFVFKSLPEGVFRTLGQYRQEKGRKHTPRAWGWVSRYMTQIWTLPPLWPDPGLGASAAPRCWRAMDSLRTCIFFFTCLAKTKKGIDIPQFLRRMEFKNALGIIACQMSDTQYGH